MAFSPCSKLSFLLLPDFSVKTHRYLVSRLFCVDITACQCHPRCLSSSIFKPTYLGLRHFLLYYQPACPLLPSSASATMHSLHPFFPRPRLRLCPDRTRSFNSLEKVFFERWSELGCIHPSLNAHQSPCPCSSEAPPSPSKCGNNIIYIIIFFVEF